MGDYVNPGVEKFEMSLGSEIYIDKSNLIAKTNARIRTRQRFICVSRPRRFGKTMAAEMLAAYYGAEDSAGGLFDDLNIAQHSSYLKHLNQYTVLMINIQEFLSQASSVTRMIENLQTMIIEELVEEYPEIKYKDGDSLIQVMKDVHRGTKQPFVILLDEWDCLFREYKDDLVAQKEYLDFLRLWLKDQVYVGLAYMTGILPIKKYGTHSALNMFEEYSMIDPEPFMEYFGFTSTDVEQLCMRFGVDIDEVKAWYNGYFVELGIPIYNPTAVVHCMTRKRIGNYWNTTETYEALKDYVIFDFDGLKDKVVNMVAGGKVYVDTRSFANDMTTFQSADDILSLLIHLGYLSYHFEEKMARIPNQEVKSEFVTVIKSLKWSSVVDAIRASEKLLKSIWRLEAAEVAIGVADVHERNTSILKYNDENALSCVISLALFIAAEYYTIVREFPAGKGYADLVYIPRKKFADKPAMIVELKWDQTVEGAIHQVKKKHYVGALDEYQGSLLLVGINYDKETKTHNCIIESFDYSVKC